MAIFKNLFSTFLLVSCITHYLFAQNNNLIHNASFETKYPGTAANVPFDQGQIHRRGAGQFKEIYLEEWRSRTWIHNNPPNFTLYHSPDYFISTAPFGQNTYYDNIRGYPAPDGVGYVGMTNYELIQQDFHKYEHMEISTPYVISMYVNTGNNFDDVLLKVYIAKKDIEYKKEKSPNDNNVSDHFCDKNYVKFVNGAAQDIITIATFDLSENITGWHKLQAGFTSPSNADKYDWIAIQLEKKNYVEDDPQQCNAEFILIDNVSLLKGCPETCSRTTGIFEDPTSSGIHDVNTPWFVTNLDNIASATIKIKNPISQNILRTITVNSPNGITNPVYWNGKNQGGAELAAGTYIATVSLTNDCGTTEYTESFIKVNGSTSNTNPPPTFPPYNTSGVVTPRPCCAGIFDYYLDNTTLSGPGLLEYKIQHDIFVATQPSTVTATSTAEVLFQAGNQVTLGSGFNAEAGSVVDIVISPCPMRIMAPENTIVTTPIQLPHTLDEEEQAFSIDNSASIIPNPSSGQFILKFDNSVMPISSDNRLSVYDMFGKIVYEKTSLSLNDEWQESIDLSFCPNGIYLVKLQSGEDIYVSKLILQK